MTTIQNWPINNGGRPLFTHEGWWVEIWGPEWPNSRITVSAPNPGEEVEVSQQGIWVYGSSPGGREGPSPVSFTIPWPVIEAIIAARREVWGC